MGVVTGFGGHIAKGTVGGGGEAAIACVRSWGIRHNSINSEVRCSASKGATIILPGNKDWGGQYGGYGAIPAVLPGQKFWFAGAIAGDGAAAYGAKGDVMVDSVQISWDIAGGLPISYVVNFGGAGALTLGTVTVPADAAVPSPLTSTGCKLETCDLDGNNPVEVAEVRTMSLTLTRANQSAHTSTSAGWPVKAKGPLTGSIQATVFAKDTDGWLSLPQPDTIRVVKMWVDNAKYWLLKFVRFNDLSNLDVDIEGAGMVGGSLGGAYSAYAPIAGVWTIGQIADPTPTTVWPE
jgi:hypothetical protein